MLYLTILLLCVICTSQAKVTIELDCDYLCITARPQQLSGIIDMIYYGGIRIGPLQIRPLESVTTTEEHSHLLLLAKGIPVKLEENRVTYRLLRKRKDPYREEVKSDLIGPINPPLPSSILRQVSPGNIVFDHNGDNLDIFADIALMTIFDGTIKEYGMAVDAVYPQEPFWIHTNNPFMSIMSKCSAWAISCYWQNAPGGEWFVEYYIGPYERKAVYTSCARFFKALQSYPYDAYLIEPLQVTSISLYITHGKYKIIQEHSGGKACAD